MSAAFNRRRRFGFGRSVHEQGLDEEMALHIALLSAELEAAGRSPAAARDEALRRFGDAAAYRAACRGIDRRQRRRHARRAWLGDLRDDLRLAARLLRREPVFAAIVLATLAIAIGANAAIFGIVDAVALRPLAFPQPEGLFMVWQTEDGDPSALTTVTPANFVDWRRQASSFSQLAAYDDGRPTLTGFDAPVRLDALRVGAGFFALLGVPAALGTTFSVGPDGAPEASLAVLSDRLFRGRFGGDPAIVGRDLVLDGVAHRVVGVMPPGFALREGTDLYLPMVFDFDVASSRGAHYLRVLGRLAPGVAPAAARAEMDAVAHRLEAAYPDTNADSGIALVPLEEQLVGPSRPVLGTLLAAVALVLLIACANVAGLTLARSASRWHEMALRSALGAGRGRLARQVLAESLLLATVGGALGVAGAGLLQRALLAGNTLDLPRAAGAGIDGRVLLFAWLVTVLACLLCALAPALRVARLDLEGWLEEGGRATPAGGRQRLRRGLVVVEVALALILVVGAGLLVRSLDRLLAVAPGFRSHDVLTFKVALPEASYPERAQRAAFFETLTARLAALPGARSAAVSPWLPLEYGWGFSFEVVGRPPLDPDQRPGANLRMISADYFQTLGIPVLAGRAFDPRDSADAAPVVIVNQTVAERHFPDQDPIGQLVTLGYGRPGAPSPERRIVGVVADVRQHGVRRPAPRSIYVPHTQIPFASMTVALRADGELMALAPAVRAAVAALDPRLAVDRLEPLAARVERLYRRPRFILAVIAAFALVAVSLAALGLYGVIAQGVAQRGPELAIRLALGARRGDLMRLVLGSGLGLALAGIAIGLAASWAGARLLASLLFEVSPTDPVTYLATAVLVALVALVASYLPARRATRVDPVATLRRG